MKKIIEFCKYYFTPVLLVIAIIVICMVILLENLPFDNSALNVNLSTEKIVVNNELLLTDSAGKILSLENVKSGITGFVEFEVTSTVNKKVKYEIYLTKEDSEKEVSSKFVKVFLTDENDNAINGFDKASIPTYYDLSIAKGVSSGKLLYSGTLRNKATEKFKLRMWVADTYEMSLDGKMFSVKLNIDVI